MLKSRITCIREGERVGATAYVRILRQFDHKTSSQGKGKIGASKADDAKFTGKCAMRGSEIQLFQPAVRGLFIRRIVQIQKLKNFHTFLRGQVSLRIL